MAAPAFSSVIANIFTDSTCYSHRKYAISEGKDSGFFVEIPIENSVFIPFEVPTFAFKSFEKILRKENSYDVLVASLVLSDSTSHYKSIDAIMRDVLSTPFGKSLTKVEVPGTPTVYYATFGAVFDSQLRPLIMLTWVMEKQRINDNIRYCFVRPVLRLDPQLFLEKEDALQRFFINKFLANALCAQITPPFAYGCCGPRGLSWTDYRVKVEIDKCPFIIRKPNVPSVSTTNGELLQLVVDHIDELP